MLVLLQYFYILTIFRTIFTLYLTYLYSDEYRIFCYICIRICIYGFVFLKVIRCEEVKQDVCI